MKQLLILLIFLPALCSAQSRIGEWRAHVSFTHVTDVAETGESIVAATANGLLFVDKKGWQLTTKTKTEGLSDAGISALAYASAPEILIAGYQNGNVDLLQKGRIINLPDLTRKNDLPDKTIYRIVCEGNFAYLCCAFGIVKIDLQRIEVAETWYFGAGGDLKIASDLTAFNGSWFVATNKGIFKADKQNTNLQDYRNWKLQSSLPQPDAGFSSFAHMDGLLFTSDTSNDRLLAWDGKNWQQQFPEIKKIKKIRSSATGLVVLTQGEIWLTGKSGNSMINSYLPGSSIEGIDPEDALTDSKGELWIADYRFGLTHRTGISSYIQLVPSSPGSDMLTALKAGPEDIFAGTVTMHSDGSKEAGISIYQAGIWQNFTSADDTELKSIQPVTSFAFSKDHPDEYWASSAGSGLLFFRNNRVAARFTGLNAALGSINGFCVVNGLATDTKNNLFYTNPTGEFRLGSRSANGNFASLPYHGMSFSNNPTGELIVSGSDIHWVILPDEGLFAFKVHGSIENISDDQSRKIAVKSSFSHGSTTLITEFSEISSIAEDRNHELWVGTGAGVVVYNNPEKVFDPGEFYGIQPSLNNGEGLFKPILDKEKITAIAVDGGNRKWFGTAHSGVFIFSEEGEDLLNHFDSKNSPLLSDKIISIAISQKSGEVFFATDKGLISFKSDATASESDLSKAYVWPNPLRETFEGDVTIDGLTDGTDVRITDVSGNLVYRGTSIGGRAVWNARNVNGVRVATGVYLIFCSSPQVTKTKIIKLLVIH